MFDQFCDLDNCACNCSNLVSKLTISEREVSPKFVFGRKKYGRRSRPESTDQDLTIEEDENLEHANLKVFVHFEDKTKAITMLCMTLYL